MKGVRYLNYKDIKSILEGRKVLKSVICLQAPKFGYYKDALYSIKLSVKGIKYSYIFFKVSNGIFTRCTDSNLSKQAKNISKLALTCLLNSYKNPIQQVSIEFILDDSTNLWIKYIKISKNDSSAVKPVDNLIFSSDDSIEDMNEKSASSKNLPELLKRSKTIINKKSRKSIKIEIKPVLKKQLTELINISENEDSKEVSISESEGSPDIDSNFLEMIAREKFKFNCKTGKGRVAPDDEYLIKEIKRIRKTFTTYKLPELRSHKKQPERIRKTLPLVNIPMNEVARIRRYPTVS